MKSGQAKERLVSFIGTPMNMRKRVQNIRNRVNRDDRACRLWFISSDCFHATVVKCGF